MPPSPQERVDAFVAHCLRDASVSATPNVMFEMCGGAGSCRAVATMRAPRRGGDFQYENSEPWFKNLDKLIHYVNIDGRVNAFYATPMMFTEALYASNYTFPLKARARAGMRVTVRDSLARVRADG